jgi:hypothetical protein
MGLPNGGAASLKAGAQEARALRIQPATGAVAAVAASLRLWLMPWVVCASWLMPWGRSALWLMPWVVSALQAVAVLNGRLVEATAALADAPIRDASLYVTMVKDIALAIAALKSI